jgi:CheY-like chemotaxis protein
VGKRILVADDDPAGIKLMRDLLNNFGYTVIEAHDGKSAVEISKAERPELIVMDIRLPILDGLQAARLIKNDTQIKTTPVICCSAYAMKEDRKRALKGGCDFYITKPFNINEFMEVVKQILE